MKEYFVKGLSDIYLTPDNKYVFATINYVDTMKMKYT
jgi:hypothetical protein